MQALPADLVHCYCEASYVLAKSQDGLGGKTDAIQSLRTCFEILDGVLLQSGQYAILNPDPRYALQNLSW